MPPDELRRMAESFTEFTMSESLDGIQEAVVKRGKQVGFVYFENVGGAWKIGEM